jgi:membrane associated rhomboid family serine protease
VFSFPPITPLVKKLIIALLAAYVIGLVLQNFMAVPITEVLALNPLVLGPLTPLQLVSHVLVPDRDPMWLLISLMFMWLMLSPFESSFGAKRTAILIVCGVLASSVAAIATAQIVPGAAHMHGGSGSISLVAAAAISSVMRRGRMLLFGVLPVTPRQLLIGLVAISVLQFLASKDLQTLSTSLATIAAGVGYVRYMTRPPRPPRGSRPSGARFRLVRGGGGASASGESERPKWLN